MKHSALLREAKRFLWDGRSKMVYGKTTIFICYAISLAAANRPSRQRMEVRKIANDITEQIAAAIHPDIMVTRWLRRKGIAPGLLNSLNIQEYRHRWLDELIRIYEEAGE